MKVVLAGATGFIGQSLISRLLESRQEVTLLSRTPERAISMWGGTVNAVQWDGKSSGDWESVFEGVDGVINLCGESIAAKRWTAEQKERIVSSRLESTKAIVRALEKVSRKPSVLVNASGVGFYGPVDGDDQVTEQFPRGRGFLAETCELWEKEALAAEKLGVRVALPRIGIVLEKDGGALQKMLPPFLYYLGGPLGAGCQWFPWVHRDDVIGMLNYALWDPRVAGPFNACAPEPVTLSAFAKTLGKVICRPSWLPVPAFVLKLLLGEMSEMLLTGQRAIPQKMRSWGYSFRYPDLEPALRSIFEASRFSGLPS